MNYRALAYYLFTPLEDPALEVKRHKEFFEGRDVAGRIYLSAEGINGQMSGSVADVEAYRGWLQSDARFASVQFKEQPVAENIFPRMTVKVRQQLVALDVAVDPHAGGEYLSPEEWREALERREEGTLVLDVRNRYEWEIGHFEGAVLPLLETFRDFVPFTEELKERVDPERTKVLMCCTGGIRCELYSALLKAKGFRSVYQLEGGLLNYSEKVGSAHFKGKIFVFDDRLAIPMGEGEGEPIGECRHCGVSSDVYYNCANMDCNELFLSCACCTEEWRGCCSEACRGSARVRPYQREGGNKPFRRKGCLTC